MLTFWNRECVGQLIDIVAHEDRIDRTLNVYALIKKRNIDLYRVFHASFLNCKQ